MVIVKQAVALTRLLGEQATTLLQLLCHRHSRGMKHLRLVPPQARKILFRLQQPCFSCCELLMHLFPTRLEPLCLFLLLLPLIIQFFSLKELFLQLLLKLLPVFFQLCCVFSLDAQLLLHLL
ncbi:uncharacterized protein Tco025E_02547 [Trypanosoma conorhini]|uniref:Uncharacterized protein n=1 Tax=Trypanosoma conorhini TaxID=83891 RepID=A0A422Q3B9_9TRYP|nr:uncharacterized protein Tco025E_02547 [Trypanosoma conorhini]RNF24450.1 hypothetical protein Tco025E_02547 [Trypanosoma conorhini]